ncbi:MAG: four helix bundle protein [Bdellovibrionota bacterium]
MIKNFRTYNIAIEFYQLASKLKLPAHLKNQLDRAASSIALNLAEGAGRRTRADQLRFYHIAFGSLRECQAILDLQSLKTSPMGEVADKLGAHLYRLVKSR